jgi:aspartate racemase
LALCQDLAKAGAAGVVLGCTELELLVGDSLATVPLFPTTRLHAEAAVKLALGV